MVFTGFRPQLDVYIRDNFINCVYVTRCTDTQVAGCQIVLVVCILQTFVFAYVLGLETVSYYNFAFSWTGSPGTVQRCGRRGGRPGCKDGIRVSTGLHRFAQVCTGLHRFAQNCSGLDRFAQACIGLHRFAQVCTGLRKFA